MTTDETALNSQEQTISNNESENSPAQSEESAPVKTEDPREVQSEQTEAPAEQTEAQSEQTEAPSEQTEVQSEQTEAPTEQTEVQSEQTEAPTEQTEVPTEQTEAPAEQTEVQSEKKEPDAEKSETEKSDDSSSKDSVEAEHEKLYEEIFKKLSILKDSNEPIDVVVKARIRGGLRVTYQDMPMFLPASHFGMKRNPPEEELQEVVGKEIKTLIHELQEDRQGRKTIIVSRKKMIEDDFWNQIEVGQVIEGTVSSIASFGIFVDIGGVEGLVHVSRLSQVRVENPRDYAKRGDKMKVKIVDVDKERKRIALSHKEFETSPWEGVSSEFEVGEQYKGIVRRLTDFGAYVEMKKGVDGLLRAGELSWTKRVKKPSDLLEPGQEVTVEVMACNEEKQTLTLSYRRTFHNPWQEIAEDYKVGTEVNGKIEQIIPQGAIVSVSEDLDGFMPRSKIKPMMKGKKIPYQPGDEIEVRVADVAPEQESLILEPKLSPEEMSQSYASQESSPQRRGGPSPKKNPGAIEKTSETGSFSLMDLISDKEKENLFKDME